MKKSLLFVCLMLAGLATEAGAQMNKSEYGRKAAEKLVKGDRAGAIAVLDKPIEQRKDLNELYATADATINFDRPAAHRQTSLAARQANFR